MFRIIEIDFGKTLTTTTTITTRTGKEEDI